MKQKHITNILERLGMVSEFSVERYQLHQILGEEYAVPDYQREYKWEEEQVDELWGDIMWDYENNHGEEPGEYLLGTVVVAKQDNKPYYMVDGQQRIVTLTLLFCAIRDSIINYNDRDIGSSEPLIKIINKYIHKENRPFVKIDSSSNDTLKDIQIGTNNSIDNNKAAKRLNNNYKFLKKRTDELCKKYKLESSEGNEKLRTLIDNLTKKIIFIFVDIKNEDYTHQIFQTLNSRGLELDQADLIKSHLLKKYKGDSENVKRQWDDTMIGVKKKDDLLYESRISRPTKPKTQKSRLYREIKKECTDNNKIDEYIKEIKTDAEFIKYLDDPGSIPDETTIPIKHAFYGIKQINAIYIRRPIITACREWGINDERTKTLVDCLLKFFFMYRTICKKDIDELKRLCGNISTKIENGNEIIDICKTIVKSDDNDQIDRVDAEIFFETFKSKTDRFSNNELRYILTSVEHGLRTDPIIVVGPCEIEHIFPKNPKNIDWPNQNLLSEYTGRLGNITLMSDRWNKSLSNHSYQDKRGTKNSEKPCYLRSELKINEEFLSKYETWNIFQIVEREEEICEEAANVWNLDEFITES